ELRDGDLLRRREVRVRELLPLAERGVDDRESLDRHAVPPSLGIKKEKGRSRDVRTSLRRTYRSPAAVSAPRRSALSVATARVLPDRGPADDPESDRPLRRTTPDHRVGGSSFLDGATGARTSGRHRVFSCGASLLDEWRDFDQGLGATVRRMAQLGFLITSSSRTWV